MKIEGQVGLQPDWQHLVRHQQRAGGPPNAVALLMLHSTQHNKAGSPCSVDYICRL